MYKLDFSGLRLSNPSDFDRWVVELEVFIIKRYLTLTHGNVKKTAKLLRLYLGTLNGKIEKYQINVRDIRGLSGHPNNRSDITREMALTMVNKVNSGSPLRVVCGEHKVSDSFLRALLLKKTQRARAWNLPDWVRK